MWYLKPTMKKGHVEATKSKYFHDVSTVRISGENIVPLPKKDEVVVFLKLHEGRATVPLTQVSSRSFEEI
jgi:hypothetical protein